ncbi:unnamed protein product [Ascophyllum nodosum]
MKKAVSGMAWFVVGLAIIGPAFDVQATTEARDGFLRANPGNEVAGRKDVDHRALTTTSDQAPPMCDNGFPGVQNGIVCCSAECGLCGGDGCSAAPGGQNSCCTSAISTNGGSCSDTGEAPCVIGDVPTAVSTCSNEFSGFQNGNVCCAVQCGLCNQRRILLRRRRDPVPPIKYVNCKLQGISRPRGRTRGLLVLSVLRALVY